MLLNKTAMFYQLQSPQMLFRIVRLFSYLYTLSQLQQTSNIILTSYKTNIQTTLIVLFLWNDFIYYVQKENKSRQILLVLTSSGRDQIERTN